MTDIASCSILANEEIKGRYNEFLDVIDTLQENLTISMHDRHQVQLENAQLKASLECKNKEILQLQEQIEKQQKTLHEYVLNTVNIFNSQSEISELKEMVSSLKAQNECNLLQIETLKKNLSQAHQNSKMQENSWKEILKKQADAIDEQKMETLNVIQQKIEKQSQLELEIEKLKEQLGSYKKQLEAARKEIIRTNRDFENLSKYEPSRQLTSA